MIHQVKESLEALEKKLAELKKARTEAKTEAEKAEFERLISAKQIKINAQEALKAMLESEPESALEKLDHQPHLSKEAFLQKKLKQAGFSPINVKANNDIKSDKQSR